MKRITVGIATLAVCGAAFGWPWSTDMMNQPSIKPQEVAPGQSKVPEFPRRSIPVGQVLTPVKNREEAKSLTNPIPVSEASIRKGRNLFKIYCSACHGSTGRADSPVSGKIGAIALTDDYVQKELTEGWIFGTITFGSYVMPAYGNPAANAERRGSNDLSVEERWHVVNYVRNALVEDGQVHTAAANKD